MGYNHHLIVVVAPKQYRGAVVRGVSVRSFVFEP